MKKVLLSVLFIISISLLFSCSECKHSFSEATCTEARVCSLCGITEGKPLGHSLASYPEKAATCTEIGYKAYEECKNCDYTTFEQISKLPHDTESHPEKAATCTEVGYKAYEECKNCDYTTFEQISKLPHDTESHPEKAATCTEVGYKAYEECKNCDYTTFEEVSKLAHELETHIAKAPSCTETGWLEYKKCKNCSFTSFEELSKANHELESFPGKAASCTEIGYKPYEKCKNCEFTTYEELSKLPHDTDSFPGKKPTCSETGYKAYEECKNCEFTTYEELSVAPHVKESYPGKEPTCLEGGWEPYEKCKNCDFTTYRELPSRGEHKYEQTVFPPTCLAAGSITYTCDCGDSYTEPYGEATGHTLGNPYESMPTTKTHDGEMRKDCLNCGYFETSDIKAIISGNFGFSGNGQPASASATYKLLENGVLKIEGEGATYNAGWNGGNQPYIDYRSMIKKVIICEGITQTSGGEFSNLTELLEVEFPSTLVKINTNAFMGSFKKGITSITIPESVTFIGTYIFGRYRGDTAVFTDVIIENPNIEIYDLEPNYKYIFNSGEINSTLRLYSYGKENSVSAYAAKIGAIYIDLETTFTGTAGNLNYVFFNGSLTLSANNPSRPVAFPQSCPWVDYTEKIESIIIEDGITEIPDEYFKDYTALRSVKLSKTVKSIGSGAFAVSVPVATELQIDLPERISYLGEQIFKNRSSVSLSAFRGSLAESFSEPGVGLKLRTAFRLLLIGNSLSLDAADNTSQGTPSILYDILKSMLGEDAYVEIATLYSGAKTAAWHATVAERNEGAYQFMVINDDTDGKWRLISNSATAKEGLLYSDWNFVTLQPYGNEVKTGVDTASSSYEKDEKFFPLSVSLPFMLDYIDEYAPTAEVYYYLTWSNVSSTSGLNYGGSDYEKMIGIAVSAMEHKGEGGKSFAGLLPVGTAIQNARSTYFALLNYSGEGDVQKNLQRDNVHLSLHVGRYIAALTFAKLLVPESWELEDYELPAIYPSDTVGELPEEYTYIARMAADLAAESVNKTGADKYKPEKILGYEKDPVSVLCDKISKASFDNIKAQSADELVSEIERIVSSLSDKGEKISITLVSSPSIGASASSFSATVKVSFGYTEKQVEISGEVSLG